MGSRPTQQKKIVTHSVVPSQYMPVYSENGQEVMISIAEFISSLGIDTDVEGYLPLAGGTMVGPIVMDATQNAYIHNAIDSEIRTQWTEDVLELMAGFGDTLFTMTKSTKAINFFSNGGDIYFETAATSATLSATYLQFIVGPGTFYIDNTGNISIFNDTASYKIQSDKRLVIEADNNLINNTKLKGLKTYADNAAAVAAGETAETVYKTASGALRIVV